MSNRIDYAKASPEVYKAFGGVYVAPSRKAACPRSWSTSSTCGSRRSTAAPICIDMHSRDLLKSGLAVDKLVLVPVWHDAGERLQPAANASRWPGRKP